MLFILIFSTQQTLNKYHIYYTEENNYERNSDKVEVYRLLLKWKKNVKINFVILFIKQW